MQRDINLIFNYSDIPEAVNQLSQIASWKRQSTANKRLKPSERLNVVLPKIIPLKFLSKFQGTEEKIHFTSSSQARIFSNQALSRLHEVSYYKDSCKKTKQGFCLWRRSASVTDNDVEKGGRSFSLLSNITSLNFRYIGGTEKNSEWKTEWKFSSEINTPNQLPHAVEITLKVKNKKKTLIFQKIALIHHSRIFIPEIKIPKITPPKKPSK